MWQVTLFNAVGCGLVILLLLCAIGAVINFILWKVLSNLRGYTEMLAFATYKVVKGHNKPIKFSNGDVYELVKKDA